MRSNPYQMNHISNRELIFLVIANIIGIGILSMPNMIANHTLFSDGWIVLGLSGVLSAVLGWICTTLSARFPQQSFFEYTSTLIPKPLAGILTLLAIGLYLCMASYETRGISVVVSIYLLNETPLQIIAFCFLLVIAYGLCNSRIALLRLNIGLLFSILVILLFLLLLTLNLIQFEQFFPLFQTPPIQYITALKETAITFSGFEIVLFYTALISQPKHAPRSVFNGIILLTILYIFVYLICVAVLSQPALQEITYPVIELGNEIEVNGGFLERFDLIFFAAWVMKLFVTTILYLDISLVALCSLFKSISKQTFIFLLMPIVYAISFLPRGMEGTKQFGYVISILNLSFLTCVPTCLLFIAFIKQREDN